MKKERKENLTSPGPSSPPPKKEDRKTKMADVGLDHCVGNTVMARTHHMYVWGQSV